MRQFVRGLRRLVKPKSSATAKKQAGENIPKDSPKGSVFSHQTTTSERL